jgi:ATP-dependent RNA helicase DeaD
MKFSLLVHLLKQNRVGLAMVFCNTQRNTDFVAQNLQQAGINALAIHGGHSQDKRTKVMNQFHAQDFEVLVCTDVAARGLDIKNVSHVYNYDIPREPNQYVHRIGRTARAGSEGMAINILASRDYDNFTQVRRHNPELRIEKEEVPQIERVMIRVKDQEFRGGGRFRSGGRERGRGGFIRSRSGGSSSSSGGFRGRIDRNSGGFRRRDDRPRSRFGRR